MKIEKHWQENPERVRTEELPLQGVLFDHQENQVSIISNDQKHGLIVKLTLEEAKAISTAIKTWIELNNI